MTQNFYSWEDAINKINFRTSSKDDLLNILLFIPMKDIHDRWSNNFSKAVGLVSRNMEIFSQTQVIFQNFLFLCEKGIDTNNEDTFVHGMLHDLLNEIFRDPTFELIWANSERFVSKNCHTSTSEEILFDEIKPKDSTSLLVGKDLIKLSNFQSGALDELIKHMEIRLV
uniref:Uncharacterized protein n=1 Tax=Rhizophagus irregularis (strain DAOM 181602 / DAOM 197198 / MUCL 43194) TaxID=747089 RepID=U9V607_RHIID